MKRLARPQGGVAAIELAITMPVLILLAFGITELGRAMYQYDTLAKSARAAARYLAVYNTGGDPEQTAAKNVAVCGAPSCVGLQPVLPGLTTANVTVAVPNVGVSNFSPQLLNIQTGIGAMNMVSVTIGAPATPYVFQSLVNFVIPDITFGPISVSMPY